MEAAQKTLVWIGPSRLKTDLVARVVKRLPHWSLSDVLTIDEAKDAWPTSGVTVVVSEPAIDGSEQGFLDWVRERYPATGRLLVVSDGRRSTSLAATTSAQQVMLASGRDDVLAAAIARMSTVSDLTHSAAIAEVVGNVDRLPTVPRVYTQLTKATTKATAGAAEIARIIETDPGMSLKVLQLANSAFFGMTRRITSIQHAVTVLGFEVLKSLVLSAHVFSSMGPPTREFSLDKFQVYSLRIARIVRRFLPDRSDDAFAAGLLHDIGRMIIGLRMPRELSRIQQRAQETNEPIHKVEREIIGTTHGAIGAYLLALWGVPFTVVEAVAFHSNPSVVPNGDLELLCAVHAAEALHEIQSAGLPDDRLDFATIERAGLLRELPRWDAIVAEERASMT
ncbi:MAG TPA: HDOD domain-containing protein [Kofleriaceae bacterium]|jgi:HD-like signal output (HDOD) protein